MKTQPIAHSDMNIVVVDDTPDNLRLLVGLLSEQGYCVRPAASGSQALSAVRENLPDLILLDVKMPAMDGYEVCERLKADERTRDIPVIFVSAFGDIPDKVRGFEAGAVDYVTKPIEAEEVLARIRTHLTIQRLQNELQTKNDDLERKNAMLAEREVHLTHLVDQKTRKFENLTLTLINALENATTLNDNDTGSHIRRIGICSAFLAEKYGCEPDFVKRIKLYAPLHDVGKVGLSDIILKKTDRYIPEERELMQKHVLFGAQLLAGEEIDRMAHNIVLYHHEKWDGSGYVHHLAGEQIPLEARIVTVVDVYDALRSKRVYKETFPEEKSLAMLHNDTGKHFDPAIVGIFFTHYQDIRALWESLL